MLMRELKFSHIIIVITTDQIIVIVKGDNRDTLLKLSSNYLCNSHIIYI